MNSRELDSLRRLHEALVRWPNLDMQAFEAALKAGTQKMDGTQRFAAGELEARMRSMLAMVRNHFGITLEPEMKTMGEI